jgi:hypothetical protein
VSAFGMLTRDVAVHGRHVGQFSMHASTNPQRVDKVGIRAALPVVELGVELPVRDTKQVSTWLVGKVSEEVSVGLKAHLFDPSLPLDIAGTFERAKDGSNSSYGVSGGVRVHAVDPTDVFVNFTQRLVTHRNVYNITEDSHVKFITNYVDMAVEASSSVSKGADFAKPPPVNVAAGLSWQLNKNFLAKLHCSTEHGVVSTAVVRNWWLPSVLAAASVGVSTTGEPFCGGRLQLSNTLGEPEYIRGANVGELAPAKWSTVNTTARFDPSRKTDR